MWSAMADHRLALTLVLGEIIIALLTEYTHEVASTDTNQVGHTLTNADSGAWTKDHH